jgi:hypothetical protein
MYTIAGAKLIHLRKIEIVDVDSRRVIILLGTKASQILVEGRVTYLLRLNHEVSDEMFQHLLDTIGNVRRVTLNYLSGAQNYQEFEGSGIPKRLLIMDLKIK